MMPTETDPPFLEFVYLPVFERTRRRVFKDDEMKDVEDTLLENPEDGDVIAGTGGVRKSRAANEDRGKSGSGRIVYLYMKVRMTIYFLLAFPKNVQANLTAEQKKAVRELVVDIKSEEWPHRKLKGTRHTR